MNNIDWKKAYASLGEDISNENIDMAEKEIFLATTLSDIMTKLSDAKVKDIKKIIKDENIKDLLLHEKYKSQINTAVVNWVDAIINIKENQSVLKLNNIEKREFLDFLNMFDLRKLSQTKKIFLYDDLKASDQEIIKIMNNIDEQSRIGMDDKDVLRLMIIASEHLSKENFSKYLNYYVLSNKKISYSDENLFFTEIMNLMKKMNYTNNEAINSAMKIVSVRNTLPLVLRDCLIKDYDLKSYAALVDSFFNKYYSIKNSKEMDLNMFLNIKEDQEEAESKENIAYAFLTLFDMKLRSDENEKLQDHKSNSEKDIKKYKKVINSIEKIANKYEFKSIKGVPLLKLEWNEIIALKSMVRDIATEKKTNALEIKEKYNIDVNLEKIEEIFSKDQEVRVKNIKEYNNFIEKLTGVNDIAPIVNDLEHSLNLIEKKIKSNNLIIDMKIELFDKHLDKLPIINRNKKSSKLTTLQQKEFIRENILTSYPLIVLFMNSHNDYDSLFHFETPFEEEIYKIILKETEKRFKCENRILTKISKRFIDNNLYLKKTMLELEKRESLSFTRYEKDRYAYDLKNYAVDKIEEERQLLINLINLINENTRETEEINTSSNCIKGIMVLLYEELLKIPKENFYQDFFENKDKYFPFLKFRKEESLVLKVFEELNKKEIDVDIRENMKVAFFYLMTQNKNKYDSNNISDTLSINLSKTIDLEKLIINMNKREFVNKEVFFDTSIFADEKVWQNKTFVLSIGNMLDNQRLSLGSISNAPVDVFAVFKLIENKNKESNSGFSQYLREVLLNNEFDVNNKANVLERNKKKL